MKIKLLEYIKNEIKKAKEEEEQIKLNKRQDVLDRISTMWSDKELEQFNINLIVSSAGWLGPCDEREAKSFIVRDNYELFTEEEISDLYAIIYSQKDVKTFKITKHE